MSLYRSDEVSQGRRISLNEANIGTVAIDSVMTGMQVEALEATSNQGGTTAERPASPITYQSYFDTTLTYAIWYNGTAWVDSAGTVV